MPFDVKSQEEYKKGGSDFGILPEDEYIFEIVGFKDEGPKADRFNPDKTYTDIRFFAKPLAYADDAEIPLVDFKTQKALNPDKTIQIFWAPERLGFGPAGPSKGRQLMAAALKRGINERFEGVEYEDFVGGKFIGAVQHNNGYDNIVSFRPLKTKADRVRPVPADAPAPTPLEAAKDAFPETDDDLPF